MGIYINNEIARFLFIAINTWADINFLNTSVFIYLYTSLHEYDAKMKNENYWRFPREDVSW